MPTFDTPEPITATVEIAAGAVRLVATDRTDTVVQVRPRDESRPHDVKAAEQVRVDFSNGTLAVSSNRGFSFPRRGAVVVDVALPSGSRLQASVASASSPGVTLRPGKKSPRTACCVVVTSSGIVPQPAASNAVNAND